MFENASNEKAMADILMYEVDHDIKVYVHNMKNIITKRKIKTNIGIAFQYVVHNTETNEDIPVFDKNGNFCIRTHEIFDEDDLIICEKCGISIFELQYNALQSKYDQLQADNKELKKKYTVQCHMHDMLVEAHNNLLLDFQEVKQKLNKVKSIL